MRQANEMSGADDGLGSVAITDMQVGDSDRANMIYRMASECTYSSTERGFNTDIIPVGGFIFTKGRTPVSIQ